MNFGADNDLITAGYGFPYLGGTVYPLAKTEKTRYT